MRRVLCTLSFLTQPLAIAQAGDESAEIAAWREFTRQLETAGVEILKSYPQPENIDRAEGLRYLLQQLGTSMQQVLIKQADQISLLRVGATTINKWGMDGADVKYQEARIDSNGTYRFYGELGSARLFAVQLTRMAGTYAAFDALTGDQLQADQDGRFDVLISSHKPDDWQGAWLALNPEADHILIREYFSDWANERPGRFQVVRLDDVALAEPLTSAQTAAQLDDVTKTFATRAPMWKARVDSARNNRVNNVVMRSAVEQGLATNAYGSSWFRIKPDEALLIELDVPDALLWSVQLGNVWWESLDYINHTTSFNDSQAVASSDDKYRFVLSLEDPGVPNWLDPAGHPEGALLFRLQDYKELVNPSVELVRFDELAKHLPADTPTVSVEQRSEEISVRRKHAAVRWAP